MKTYLATFNGEAASAQVAETLTAIEYGKIGTVQMISPNHLELSTNLSDVASVSEFLAQSGISLTGVDIEQKHVIPSF